MRLALSIIFVLTFFSPSCASFETSYRAIEKSWWTVPRQVYRDSATIFLKSAKAQKNDWAIAKGLYLKAKWTMEHGLNPEVPLVQKYIPVHELLNQSDSILKRIESWGDYSVNCALRTHIHRQLTDFKQSVFWINEAKLALVKDSSSLAKAWWLYRNGEVLYAINQISAAVENFYKSADFFEKEGYPVYAAICKMKLAGITLGDGSIQRAKDLFDEAELGMRSNKAWHALNYFHYIKFGYYVSVKKYEKARSTVDSIYNLEEMLNCRHNLNIRNIQLATVFEAKKEYNNAINQLNKIIDYFFESDDISLKHMSNLYYKIGRLRYKKGEVKTAIDTLKKSIDYAKQGNKLVSESSANFLLYQCYESVDSIELALAHYKRHKLLSDSVNKLKKSEQLNLVETYYKTDQLQKDKALLNVDLDVLELKNERNNLMITVGGFSFVVIFALIIILYSRRSLALKNKELKTQYKLLQSQMNPHFIFNALNTIQYSVLEGDGDKASSLVSKLGKLIRDVLESSRVEFISLKREIRMLNNYLKVQQERFDNKFKFEVLVEVSEDLDSIMIPPMMLQPFVENAVEHGVKNLGYEGLIKVRLQKIKGNLKVKISDNGVGFSEKKNDGHESLSLKIIRERLTSISKGKQKVNINSSKYIGTKVEFYIPLNETV